MTHQIHDRLPAGFKYADAHQSQSFEATGSINGAAKVALVRWQDETVVACRLRPPRTWGDVISARPRREAGLTGFVDRPDNTVAALAAKWETDS